MNFEGNFARMASCHSGVGFPASLFTRGARYSILNLFVQILQFKDALPVKATIGSIQGASFVRRGIKRGRSGRRAE
jgi:hypothetical protein